MFYRFHLVLLRTMTAPISLPTIATRGTEVFISLPLRSLRLRVGMVRDSDDAIKSHAQELLLRTTAPLLCPLRR